ncbi:LCP family protein [Staphylococcus massiliensis]|uniref:Transcriptional regulator n=1 Tax=Staphylococcus massiliensis S46 TaxID=1229783 RepID=K9B5F4_9STAP|nr:LCP family protein [Staphylococcus massiliensis]EKU48985.1 transcriptional regulator [Staphylococcus massiliensis S46]
MRGSYEKKRHPLKKLLLIIGGIVGLLFAALLIFICIKAMSLSGAIHHPLDRDKSSLRDNKVDINKSQPISIALFGVDSNTTRDAQGAGERSDSIMILSINPQTKTTEMISIPRDTQAEIVGNNTTEKINHAYAYGGPKMAIESVEKLMNVPIDHYASVDMDGLKETIDALDGVDVVSNATFNVKGTQFNQGEKVHLNGEEAMNFIRSRKEDGSGGDFGRQQRQQIVLQGLASKLTDVKSITRLNTIIEQLEKNVETDLTLGQLNTIIKNYKHADETVNKHQLEGSGSVQDDGVYYFVPDENQKSELTRAYRENLNI